MNNSTSSTLQEDSIGLNIMKQLQNTLPSSSDIQNQNDINQSLINAGLPINKINSLIQLTKDKIMCDSNCQRDRKAQELRKTFYNAEQNLSKAPCEVTEAEKNFYVYTKGEKGYEDMMLTKYTKQASKLKEEAILKHKELVNELYTLIYNYKTDKTNLSRLNELMSIRLEENEKLKKIIYDNTGIANTNDRRVVYEDRAMNWLTTVRKSLVYCLILIFALYIIFGDFFRNQRYKKVRTWLTFLAFILYMWNIDRLSQLTFFIVYKIKSFYTKVAPHDIYTNL